MSNVLTGIGRFRVTWWQNHTLDSTGFLNTNSESFSAWQQLINIAGLAFLNRVLGARGRRI